MSLFRSAALILAALPLVAQDAVHASQPQPEPVVDDKVEPRSDRPAYSMLLEVDQSSPLRLWLHSGRQQEPPFLGVLLAATHEKTLRIEGLPPLLLADAIVATGFGKGGMHFDLGEVRFPFSIWLQGVSIRDGVVETSPLLELPAAR